jgi:hypothetical protein
MERRARRNKMAGELERFLREWRVSRNSMNI